MYTMYAKSIVEILKEENISFETLCKRISRIFYKTSFLCKHLTFLLINLDFIGEVESDDTDVVIKHVIERYNEIYTYMNSQIFPSKIWAGGISKTPNDVGIMENKELWLESFLDVNRNQKLNKTLKCTLLRCNLNSMGETLYKVGYLEEKNNLFNYKLRDNYIRNLGIELGEFKKEEFIDDVTPFGVKNFTTFDGVTVSEAKTLLENFSMKFLTSLSENELVILNSFWVNKVAKVSGEFIKILYVISKNWDVVSRKNLNFKELYCLLKNEMGKPDIDKVFLLLKECYVNKTDSNPTLNMLLPLYKCYANAYFFKNFTLFYFLKKIEKNQMKFLKNYGFIEESDSMMIFVCDYKGYILPFSFHIPKKQFENFYRCQNISSVRRYLGADDFFMGKEPFKTSIIYRVPGGSTNYIKEKSRINDRLAHIAFIQTGKWPKHLKDENGKIKKYYITI